MFGQKISATIVWESYWICLATMESGGLFFVGDCKMMAFETRLHAVAGGDCYLGPFSKTQIDDEGMRKSRRRRRPGKPGRRRARSLRMGRWGCFRNGGKPPSWPSPKSKVWIWGKGRTNCAPVAFPLPQIPRSLEFWGGREGVFSGKNRIISNKSTRTTAKLVRATRPGITGQFFANNPGTNGRFFTRNGSPLP